MPQLDSDAFTYSNGALASVSGGKWTDLSGLSAITVLSNAVHGAPAANSAAVIASWSGSVADQYSQLTVTILGSDVGPTVRSDANNNFIVADFLHGDAVYVFEVVSGTFNQLGATMAFDGGNLHVGDVCYIEIQGTTITVKQNGVTLGTRTLSLGAATGKPGIFAFDSDTQFDDWAAGDFGGGGGETITLDKWKNNSDRTPTPRRPLSGSPPAAVLPSTLAEGSSAPPTGWRPTHPTTAPRRPVFVQAGHLVLPSTYAEGEITPNTGWCPSYPTVAPRLWAIRPPQMPAWTMDANFGAPATPSVPNLVGSVMPDRAPRRPPFVAEWGHKHFAIEVDVPVMSWTGSFPTVAPRRVGLEPSRAITVFPVNVADTTILVPVLSWLPLFPAQGPYLRPISPAQRLFSASDKFDPPTAPTLSPWSLGQFPTVAPRLWRTRPGLVPAFAMDRLTAPPPPPLPDWFGPHFPACAPGRPRYEVQPRVFASSPSPAEGLIILAVSLGVRTSDATDGAATREIP